MLRSEPIFEATPAFASCHAATIVDVADGGLLAAWFGGTDEGHPDVAIWLSRHGGEGWSEPIMAADVPEVPLWNPVLFRDATDTVWLFYKVALTTPAWTGAYIRSRDGGQTWSPPAYMPAGLLGPIKNKPIILSNGDILSGSSCESWRSWACWMEISDDGGRTWSKHGPIAAPGVEADAADPEGAGHAVSAVWDDHKKAMVLPKGFPGIIQPSVWEYAPGKLRMVARATRDVGYVCTASSDDYGRTWAPATATEVPNPNSGLDAVRISDGRIVLVTNPTVERRSPLSLLVSEDDGETWPIRLDLDTEPGELSYPAIIQAQDGTIHVVYTYLRHHIQHVTLHPDDLVGS